MPKESFLYSDTKPVFDLIEEASRRSGVSRGQAFEGFVHMSLCALSGGQMEEQYMATVKKHAEGKKGKRGCDSIARAFGTLIDAMEKTHLDILGDIFQGGITYGEAGQFMTPEAVCDMMARMTTESPGEEPTGERKTVGDPCCGSGRMLLAVANLQPHWEFVGQDVDLRCVRMTALNLALRNLYGYVIWGNSLGNERRLIYRTGFNHSGFVREIPIEECSESVRQLATEQTVSPQPPPEAPTSERDASSDELVTDPTPVPAKQLRLF